MSTSASKFYVYVIELKAEVAKIKKVAAANPAREIQKPCLYVGHSAHTPAFRFEQHLNGYKANRYVKKFGLKLRPDLYEKYNPLTTRGEAEEQEEALAEYLRTQGCTVWYGI